MPSPAHIVIACSYLHVPGGYEKAMISTANLFITKGHRVTLLILDHTAETFYPVHPAVTIVHLPLNFGITGNGNTISRKLKLWQDIKKLGKVLKQLNSGHLICSEYPFAVAALAAGAHRFTKIYSWEHHHYRAQQMNRFWNFLFRRYYPKLDAVICLNKDEQKHYLSINPHSVVIPNFIAPSVTIETTPGIKEFSLISVTRFNAIKGIDLLMNVAQIILPGHPWLKWMVIGYGEQKDEFLDFIRKEGFSNQLIYRPADKTDISHEYRNAGLLVMTSRNECFPLVLLEAMSNGLPCMAFDCDTGPRHIIRHNETGLLVAREDINEMAAAILSLLNDNQKRGIMSKNALQAIKSFYPDAVYPLWEQLFNKNS